MYKKKYSWGTIILLLILFFPVGIWMIVKKMSDEKHHYLENGRCLKTYGFVLLGLGIFYLIMGFLGEIQTEDDSSIVGNVITGLIIFCGGGLLMIRKGKQFMTRGKKFNRYVAIINAENDTSIDRIASAYPTTYTVAVNDLQQMLDFGYFLNAYIDQHQRALIMPPSKSTNFTSVMTDQNNNLALKKPRIIKCPSCGAINKILPGKTNECEYCGSPLE